MSEISMRHALWIARAGIDLEGAIGALEWELSADDPLPLLAQALMRMLRDFVETNLTQAHADLITKRLRKETSLLATLPEMEDRL